MNKTIALNVFNEVRQFLLSTGKKPTIILKQTEHFGDTLYATPILRHLRLKYPGAAIAFVTGNKYADIHQYNPHIDKLFTVPVMSDWRKDYYEKVISLPDIDIKLAPAVVFGTFVPSMKWSLPNIFDQYLTNAGIPDLQLLGGRQPVAIPDQQDEQWVTDFLTRNRVDPRIAIALEYHSYSHSNGWSPSIFQEFCIGATNKFWVICLAAQNEGLFTHTVDGRGMSWRRSAALLNRIRGIVGVSSGMSVLAASCPNKPFIYEINCPDSISILKMGFTENCRSLINLKPWEVVDLVHSRIRS